MESFIKNRDLPEVLLKTVTGALRPGESILCVLVSDMSFSGEYRKSLLALTDKGIISVNGDAGEVKAVPYEGISSASFRRMYGNALINVTLADGSTEMYLRGNFALSSFCEAVIQFITGAVSGEDTKKLAADIGEIFEKNECVCPKCGRKLLHPGAECMQCGGKGKLITKLSKYVIPYKWRLIISLSLSVITTVAALLPPYVTKVLVDEVIPASDKSKLFLIVGVLLGTYVLQYLIGGIKGYILRCTGDRITEDIRNDVFEKAQHLPMKFYDKTSTGSVINRISSDTSALQQFIMRVTQEVVVQFFSMIGIVIIMIVMNWKLSLLSLIPVPAVVIGARYFGKKIRPFYRRIWRKWAAVSSIMTDAIPCVRVVKTFAGEKRTAERFKRQNVEWRRANVRAAKLTNVFPAVVSFAISCGSLLIWGLGGSWVIDSQGSVISLGLLVSFLSYTSMFYGPVSFFANFNDSCQSALTSAERIFDIIDAEPEPDYHAAEKVDKIRGEIEFRHVNFSFDKTKRVLSDINLKIAPGDIVGIVGTTGSGKSTLINLLMRFYDSYDGEILVDGKDIRDMSLEEYRSRIGYVQQEPMMFSDSIFNNIAYGIPNAPVEAVVHAADIANAHGFIINQPDAYDTMLGERGVGLSGGEKQRLSIARAVLKNPSVLIFDEATAAVDSETESLIQQAIERLIRGRTTLMIAHRLSTLRRANKIVVVDAGKIIECGTHEEIMALNGKYKKLVEIQSMSDLLKEKREQSKLDIDI